MTGEGTELQVLIEILRLKHYKLLQSVKIYDLKLKICYLKSFKKRS